MSALPNQHLPIQESEPEVIYLVVPPAVAAPLTTVRPYSLAERLSVVAFNLNVRTHSARERGLAIAFACFATVVAGLWAYNVKSAFGIDIFPHQHLESFAPLPGWQR